LKSQRKQGDFDLCKAEIAALKGQEQKGEIDLWFSNETSFSLNPNSMYAWQAANSDIALAAQRGKVSTVLGFIRTNNESQFYDFQANLCSHLWIKIVDDFVEKQPPIKTVILIDNASTHKAIITQNKIIEWESKNVFIHYLKAYCCELNPIEIVWRFIKHKWLSVADYLSANTLKRALEKILNAFGKNYKIDFQS